MLGTVSSFFYHLDVDRIVLIFPGNIENRLRHRRGEKDRLTSLRRNILKNRLDVIAEAHVQHLVRLIEYHRGIASQRIVLRRR